MSRKRKGAGALRRMGKAVAAAAMAAALLQPCGVQADGLPNIDEMGKVMQLAVGPGASIISWCEYCECTMYGLASNTTLIAGATGVNLLLEIVLKAVKSIQAGQMEVAAAMDARGAAESRMIEAAFEDFQSAYKDAAKAAAMVRLAKIFDPNSKHDPCLSAGAGTAMAGGAAVSRAYMKEAGKIATEEGPGTQPDYARVWSKKAADLAKLKDEKVDVIPTAMVFTPDELKRAVKADIYRASPHPLRDVAEKDAETSAGARRKAAAVQAKAVHGTISGAAAALRDLYTANPAYKDIVNYVQEQDELPEVMRFKPQPTPAGGTGFSPMQALRMLVDHYSGLKTTYQINDEDEGTLSRLGVEMNGVEAALMVWTIKLENALLVLESIETASAVNNAQKWESASDPRLSIGPNKD